MLGTAVGEASTVLDTMIATRTLVVLLVVGVALASPHVRRRRQLPDDNTLQPIEDAEGDEQTREKRKLEGVTQAKLGIKNAVLGFVFGKINQLIDAKTRFVDTLDKKNIEINKQYGIEPPQNGLSSIGGVVTQFLQPKLQFIGPKVQAVSSLFGGSSGSGSSGGQEWHYIAPPSSGRELRNPDEVIVDWSDGHGHGPSDQTGGRHPSVRQEQSQPGLPREFVWAVRVPTHQDY
ncbi:uncharacterized protein LOC128678245 isoform X1 [Plodia interpunctella]|uniref:uncharacterized protein LOC128678245 isoform X1 n=1 Tax=Plodia interpunctella TaxID=58824 RepID=UPI002367E64C|nr:uncharacterized protein LOC128678245 isoform X1 [Plodia interpunctella]